jgi:hypothetical protein
MGVCSDSRRKPQNEKIIDSSNRMKTYKTEEFNRGKFITHPSIGSIKSEKTTTNKTILTSK